MKKVGKIKEAHGLRGEVYVLIFSGDISWLSKLDKVQLQSPEGMQVRELTLEKAKPFKNGFILKTKEINDRNQSESLKGMEFYIPDEFLISEPGETIYLEEILHFHIQDPQGKRLGEVINFSSNTAQDLLVLSTPQGEREIPFVEAFIVKIDFQNRVIIMELPEGLLD